MDRHGPRSSARRRDRTSQRRPLPRAGKTAIGKVQREKPKAPTFTVRRAGRRLLLEVTIGKTGKFTVDREHLREWLASLVHQTYLKSWGADEAQVTARYASQNALNFFEDRLRDALVVALNALADGAVTKALDDWKGQVVTVSAETSLLVPALDDLKSKARNDILKGVTNAWREILDFRGKGGVYPDGSKEERYVAVFRFWEGQFAEFIKSGIDDQQARKLANAKTMKRFKIKSYSTLAAWRRAGRSLS